MQFIAKYSKTEMQNMDEFNHKYDIFKDNYKRIIEHNSIPDSGFSLEINKFADLTDDEFISKYTGAVIPKEKTEKMKNWTVPTSNERRLKELPDHKSWYDEGAVTRPLNQGGCGGCWAFSTASSVESLAYISGTNDELEEFSV
jgi:C1A family cysteine protease